jgi:hypothetical protein
LSGFLRPETRRKNPANAAVRDAKAAKNAASPPKIAN